MGVFLDKFESFVLNYSRRIISAAILIALLILSWNLVFGTLNTFDSPNTELDDSFNLPEFIEPSALTDDSDLEDGNQENTLETEEDNRSQIDIDYADEIDEMTETIFPLYVSLKGFSLGEEMQMRDYLSEAVEGQIYERSFSRDQRDDWVDGAVDYIDELSDYFIDKYDISKRNPVALDMEPSAEDDEYLKRPLSKYITGANAAYREHLNEVSESETVAAGNNLDGVGQLFTVLYSLGAVIFMVLMLLIFKAENSLRRSADAIEKD